MKLPAKTPVVGTPISMTSYEEVIDLLDQAPSDRSMTIAIGTVHSVMTARKDPEIRTALNNADALVLVTEWRIFQSPDFDLLKKLMNNPVIFDGRNIYSPELLREKGFTYYGIGRGLAS